MSFEEFVEEFEKVVADLPIDYTKAELYKIYVGIAVVRNYEAKKENEYLRKRKHSIEKAGIAER